jgi:hypothetical protein
LLIGRKFVRNKNENFFPASSRHWANSGWEEYKKELKRKKLERRTGMEVKKKRLKK